MNQILHLKLYFYIVSFAERKVTAFEELDYLSNVCGLQQRLWKNAKGKVYCSLPFQITVVCLSCVSGLLFFFSFTPFSLSAKVFFSKHGIH